MLTEMSDGMPTFIGLANPDVVAAGWYRSDPGLGFWWIPIVLGTVWLVFSTVWIFKTKKIIMPDKNKYINGCRMSCGCVTFHNRPLDFILCKEHKEEMNAYCEQQAQASLGALHDKFTKSRKWIAELTGN